MVESPCEITQQCYCCSRVNIRTSPYPHGAEGRGGGGLEGEVESGGLLAAQVRVFDLHVSRRLRHYLRGNHSDHCISRGSFDFDIRNEPTDGSIRLLISSS